MYLTQYLITSLQYRSPDISGKTQPPQLQRTITKLVVIAIFEFFLLFFAVFVRDCKLHFIIFTWAIALNCTIFDAVVDKAFFNIQVVVVNCVTVLISIVLGGIILGCQTVFLDGGFNWWICYCYSLSSTDFIANIILSCTDPISCLKESLVELISTI